MLQRLIAITKQEVNSRCEAWSSGWVMIRDVDFFSVCYVKLNSRKTLSEFNICIYWI